MMSFYVMGWDLGDLQVLWDIDNLRLGLNVNVMGVALGAIVGGACAYGYEHLCKTQLPSTMFGRAMTAGMVLGVNVLVQWNPNAPITLGGPFSSGFRFPS